MQAADLRAKILERREAQRGEQQEAPLSLEASVNYKAAGGETGIPVESCQGAVKKLNRTLSGLRERG